MIRSTSTADHSAIYAIWCDPMLVMMTIFKDDDLDDQARDALKQIDQRLIGQKVASPLVTLNEVEHCTIQCVCP